MTAKPVDLMVADPGLYTHRHAASAGVEVAGAGATERAFAEVLAAVLQVDQVPLDDNFFEQLGADSMVMARFCARVRKRPELPSVSMKDIYLHPTIRSLSEAFPAPASPTPAIEVVSPAEATPVPGPDKGAAPGHVALEQLLYDPSEAPGTRSTPATASRMRYLTCGALQLLVFLGYSYLAAVVAVRGYDWISAGSGPVDDYLRALVFGGAAFLGVCILPVVVKWVLIGRWKATQIPVWSLGYVRFWTVKTLLRANPVVLFSAGTPLYVMYLRSLGAKIGRDVTILSRQLPVCTDLFSVGDGTVIRKDALISCYRARAGMIETGPVALGRNVLISEATVVDVGTVMGDDSQLGHRSSLHTGQVVPAGERWHGSPGQRTDSDFRTVAPARCGSTRRAVYTALQVLTVLLVNVPLTIGGMAILTAALPELDALLNSGPSAFTSWAFYLETLAGSALVFFGAVLLGCVLVPTIPRLLSLALKPDTVYPLYGFHYSIQRTIARTTNIKFLTSLFGDSSYIVGYLRRLGYDLGDVEQTGSNFGTGVKHETPFLITIGRGTMIADGLSVINADFSNTSFQVSRTTIGPRNFLGNSIAYPARGRTGDNCLLATKVMVPIDGKLREGVGLLGSPSFEIPRSVLRDSNFDDLKTEQEIGRHLAAKNRYNLRTMGVLLFVRWLNFTAITFIALAGAEFEDSLGAVAIAIASVLILGFSVAYGSIVERAVMRFRRLKPQFCSIYDPYFWRHERLWKLLSHPEIFNGTPFKSWAWRMVGVRLGRQVFDDGCGIPERTLVTIGDHCTLNAGSEIQGHSQEDGAFKSDRIVIGADCTLGVGSLVHYGVSMGDAVELEPDSFLMKGEQVPAGTHWGGNPAGELRPGGTERHNSAIVGELRRPGRHRRGTARPTGQRPAGSARVPHGRHRSSHGDLEPVPAGRHAAP